ncbi:MAG TPA: hypothetical protein PLK92_02590 [Candidatus Paceibacterota bacterium]|jgi:hypothetical protein|nr:hypothetical protein [Candidatus Paceibacterota bacterium]HOY10987.1 hypothetical protein [Candidatus Paceibacterota bacterium]HPB60581.1 hypothetical protein [Candidatus Paceibacterota bacterium]HQF40875.1 hypothetical protein [Candidatus Paceibacterota bacterium]HQJ83847.1 hypothetical protein [Candidatus Paceibacterota bacterium]
MTTLENILKKREARLRSPAFQAEINKEKAEFQGILRNLGNNALEAGLTFFFRGPLKMTANTLKLMYAKNYDAQRYGKDAFKIFFGKNGVMHSTVRVTANALHLTSKSVKIGFRKLIAK